MGFPVFQQINPLICSSAFLFPGEDISVCVCLAILTSLFDDGGSLPESDKKVLVFYIVTSLFIRMQSHAYRLKRLVRFAFSVSELLFLNLQVTILSGNFDDGKSFSQTGITKMEMRRRLVFLCKFATNARPSRGNLKQVFSFLSSGRVDPV